MRIAYTPQRLEQLDRQIADLADDLKLIIDSKESELADLRRKYEALTGKGTAATVDGRSNGSGKRPGRPPSKTPKATAKSSGKRTRRSADELKQQAKEIVDFITAGGDDGRSGTAIRATYPDVIQEGTTIVKFVQQYGGVKLKTTGKATAMIYFHPKG